MRNSLTCLIACVAAIPAYADQFTLNSRVTTAELYPQGATLTREVAFDLPAGDHQVLIADLPRSVPLDALRIGADGVTIGAVTLRHDALPPQDAVESDAVQAARTEVERIEDLITQTKDDMALINARVKAAQMTLDTLGKMQITPDLTGATDLGALASSLSASTLAALEQKQQAQQDLRPLQDTLEDQTKDLEDAQAALDALQPGTKPHSLVTVSVSADQPTQGVLRMTYVTPNASWTPAYDIHLDRAASQLRVTRSALIAQTTGEPWQDVQIAMSTTRPSGQVAPSQLWPWLRSIYDPEHKSVLSQRSSGLAVAEAAPMSADFKSVDVEMTEGLKARYTYDVPVDLGSSADTTRISLGQTDLEADVFARAIPARDATAFMAAKTTNDSGEQILPAQAWFYLDGDFVGQQYLDGIAPGADVEFSFGPIEGLQLSQIQRANEGDTGLLRSRNDRSETATYEIENLTNLDWDVRMLAQVPYSEQDDLKITWDAAPTPSDVDVDGKQGILEWQLRLGAKTTQTVRLNHRLQWPDGQQLN